MELKILLVVGAAIALFALVAGRARESALTPPMFFVALGIVVGPTALGWVDAPLGHGVLHLLAEITLAIILFSDASRIDLGQLWRDHDIPLRMLLVGLPLCIAAGTGAAMLLFGEFTWVQALLVGAILAPTDAALGQAVMSEDSIPTRVRQSLNVESGLNDGLAYPAVFVVISSLSSESSSLLAADTAVFVAQQVGIGVVVGVVLGGGMGYALEHMHRRGWTQDAFLRLSGLGIALGAVGLAGLIGGNGFIAAFVAGLTFGRVSDNVAEPVHHFGEVEGSLLGLLTFLALGLVVVPAALAGFDWRVAVYALLSLTVIRMVPVAVSLLGLGLRRDTIAFLGWFGPRGVASVVFLMLLASHESVADLGLITSIGVTTIVASVFLHGASSSPLSRRYGARFEKLADVDRDRAEHREVGDLRYRHRKSS